MKISKLILENFRGFYGKHEISFDNFNVFIGKNDQGKSSILEAIDIFIYEGKGNVKIESTDLNINAQKDEISEFKIALEFSDIPKDVIIDATNPTSLEDEYLLNENNLLEIWKIFRNGKLTNTLLRCKHPVNDDFLKDIMKKKINELQGFVEEKGIYVVDKRKAAELRKSIREYYMKKDGELKYDTIDLPINADGLKDIWSQLNKYLPIYALFHSDRENIDQDAEIQDPLKIKIEQVFKNEKIQKTLEDIANEVNNEIKEIADLIIHKFKEISTIETSIYPDIPDVSDLKWKDVYKNLGFKTEDDVPLNKRGSGFRRIVLLSSLLADVEKKTEGNEDSHVIYAIEEPETSLHPDLQIKLVNSLIELSKKANYQVIMTTHSPALIRLFETKYIKFVEKVEGESNVFDFSEEIAGKIIENLGLLPEISKVVLCVEGTTDELFLININQNIEELKKIINLEECIKNGLLSVIPMHGANLKDWINRYALKNTNVIEYHLYDRDHDEKYKEQIEIVNSRKDGSKARLTKKREIENYVPKEIIETEFGITLDIKEDSEWDNLDIVKAIQSYDKCKKMKEVDIKSKICGSCAKKITKDHLEKLGAWDEVKTWFEEIKDLVNKTFIKER
ncbi:MAG: ATP-binding protein [Leptospiraceae bacterium]|nr:ATP-binding protein [Leptospiraceae bacterium]